MKEDYYNNSKDYINRWVISYADLVTLLLTLFLVMFAVNSNPEIKKQINEEFNNNKLKSEHVNKSQSEKKLEKKLIDEFSNENIAILKDDRGYIIRLPEKVLFSSASAELDKKSYDILNKITDILSKIENPVIIEGHTDSCPIKSERFSSNWELSATRATSVISYFVTVGKLNPKRLSAVGYGEYSPIAENTSNSGRTKNRRVDIIILDKCTGE